MPSTGFYLFLLKKDLSANGSGNLCQCPQRASTYFFIPTGSNKNPTGMGVSMPSTGFYLFLPRFNVQVILGLDKLCQCPQRASTYFFGIFMTTANTTNCVNALNGLLLISSNQKNSQKLVDIKSVSMPSTGFYLFLRHAQVQ